MQFLPPATQSIRRVRLANLLPVCRPSVLSCTPFLEVTVDGVVSVGTTVARTVALDVGGQTRVRLGDGMVLVLSRMSAVYAGANLPVRSQYDDYIYEQWVSYSSPDTG